MTYQPQCLSGRTLHAAEWAIRHGNARRLWNIQSAYNMFCLSGPCHNALSRDRLRGKMHAAADRGARAQGAWEVFTTTVAHDARRGAYAAATVARPATWMVDALAGTGRAAETKGTPETRLLMTVDSLATHFTNTGVVGAILLGTAVGSALVGAVLGFAGGVMKSFLTVPFAWITDRRPGLETLQRTVLRSIESNASKAVAIDVGMWFLQVQALRCATAALKLGIAGAGACLGAAVGSMHGLAASYSYAMVQRQLEAPAEDYSLPPRASAC